MLNSKKVIIKRHSVVLMLVFTTIYDFLVLSSMSRFTFGLEVKKIIVVAEAQIIKKSFESKYNYSKRHKILK